MSRTNEAGGEFQQVWGVPVMFLVSPVGSLWSVPRSVMVHIAEIVPTASSMLGVLGGCRCQSQSGCLQSAPGTSIHTPL